MTSELKPCPLSGELLSIASNYRECLLEIELQTLVKAAEKITRAASDVPELRVTLWFDGSQFCGCISDEKWVAYDQAAAIIAYWKSECEREAKLATDYASDCLAEQKRAEAAEGKLAQINDQKPVTHYIVSNFGGEFDKVKMMPIGRHPLYAAPVASDADLRADNERLREALRLNLSIVKLQNGNLYDDINQIIAKGEAALNPSEQRK